MQFTLTEKYLKKFFFYFFQVNNLNIYIIYTSTYFIIITNCKPSLSLILFLNIDKVLQLV